MTNVERLKRWIDGEQDAWNLHVVVGGFGCLKLDDARALLTDLEHAEKVKRERDDAVHALALWQALLSDGDLELKIARECNDTRHDDRYCDTCSARDDGITDYRLAIQELWTQKMKERDRAAISACED